MPRRRSGDSQQAETTSNANDTARACRQGKQQLLQMTLNNFDIHEVHEDHGEHIDEDAFVALWFWTAWCYRKS